jgi:DNA-binding MarR family transcriptional regulator
MPSIDQVTGVFFKWGYALQQVAVLDSAYRFEGSTAHSIAGRIGLSQASVAGSLSRLSADKLIVVKKIPDRKIGNAIKVTRRGVKFLNTILQELNEDEGSL